jgi:hypothetical protein
MQKEVPACERRTSFLALRNVDEKRRRIGKIARIAFPSADRSLAKNFTDGGFR